MNQKESEDDLRARRWAHFRQRAEHAPEAVYRHRTHGWEYIPVHPFGDEPEILERLGLRPEDCKNVDAWWAIDGDATLLELSVEDVSREMAGLYAKASPREEHWINLLALYTDPYVTRAAFESAMVLFAEAGFPRGPRFQLRWGDPIVRVPEGKVVG